MAQSLRITLRVTHHRARLRRTRVGRTTKLSRLLVIPTRKRDGKHCAAGLLKRRLALRRVWLLRTACNYFRQHRLRHRRDLVDATSEELHQRVAAARAEAVRRKPRCPFRTDGSLERRRVRGQRGKEGPPSSFRAALRVIRRPCSRRLLGRGPLTRRYNPRLHLTALREDIFQCSPWRTGVACGQTCRLGAHACVSGRSASFATG